MARKGNKRHVKRIAAPKKLMLTDKKEKVFMKKVSPGPHPKHNAIPLVVLLRDILKVAKNEKEVRAILNDKKVRIDGKIRRDIGFPVGLMDVIDLGNASYRIMLDEKGRLVPIVNEKELLKPLKIVNKVSIGKDKFQLTFHDGRTLLTSDNNFKVGDVVLFDLSKKEVVELVKNKEGVHCLIVDGRHAGKKGKVKEIVSRGGKREVVIESSEGEIITRHDYVFPLPEGW